MLDLQNKSRIARKPRIEITEEERAYLIKQCKQDKTSAGRTQYLRFLNGEKLTYREAMLAKCYECDGGHSDGRYDCEVPTCSLYPYMPYNGNYATNN